jgi:hypothetical protein
MFFMGALVVLTADLYLVYVNGDLAIAMSGVYVFLPEVRLVMAARPMPRKYRVVDVFG